MKNPFIAAAMMMAAMSAAMCENTMRAWNSKHMGSRGSRRFKTRIDERGYAGAKLARKAADKALTHRHC